MTIKKSIGLEGVVIYVSDTFQIRLENVRRARSFMMQFVVMLSDNLIDQQDLGNPS